MRQVVIFIDRDGTIGYDDKFHLGHQRNWKSKVKILPNVVKGLKKLKKIPNIKIYLITNQPGVAIKSYPKLTLDKANEVCEFILERLKKNGVELNGYEVCDKASLEYVKTHPEFEFDKKLVGNFNCIKPGIGMIKSILKREKIKNPKIYVLGDRDSDVKTALNAKGIGVLVPFSNRPDEGEKVKKIKSKKIYISKNFLDAVRFIVKREN